MKTNVRTTAKFVSILIFAGIFSSLPAAANPFEAVKGSWRGAVQFDARHAPEAHSVGTLSLHIGVDGAVDAVHANGCKLSGIVKSDATGSLFQVDARMTGCTYSEFNRRWNGSLIWKKDQRVLNLSLTAVEAPPGKPMRFLDVSGTLQR